jgi:Flp pilus assembly protein TadD
VRVRGFGLEPARFFIRRDRLIDAVELLERALSESKEPAFYNRLGVILAMKKREFGRAQELIGTALKLAPGNATYQHNLGKVLSMAAAHDVESRNAGASKKGGLLGFLGRKK